MTVMESLCGPGKEILLVAVMLFVLLHAYLLMAFSRLGRKGFFAVLEGIQFLLLFAGFFLMLDGIFHYGDPSKPRTWPFFTRAFCSLPLVPVLIFLLFSAACFLYGNYRARRFRREHLTPGAIKETIDLLPAGVAFAEEDGDVVLSNLCMNRLAESLTGKNLMKLTPLMELAEKKEGEDALPAAVNGEMK